jgi:hypothetical protein
MRSYIEFERHKLSSLMENYEPNFIYQKSRCAGEAYSLITAVQSLEICKELYLGHVLRCRDIMHFCDDDANLLEYALSNRLVVAPKMHQFCIEIRYMHLMFRHWDDFNNDKIFATFVCELCERRDVSISEICIFSETNNYGDADVVEFAVNRVLYERKRLLAETLVEKFDHDLLKKPTKTRRKI